MSKLEILLQATECLAEERQEVQGDQRVRLEKWGGDKAISDGPTRKRKLRGSSMWGQSSISPIES